MTRAATAIDSTDWLVGQLQQLARTRALQYTLEVGRLVVTHVFGGSLDNLQKRGRSDLSYRQLARRGDLPFSTITLWRCVKVYELVERFPALLAQRHLALAHLRAVAALPPPTQQALLDQALANAWTSEDLVRAARRTRAVRLDVTVGAPRALTRNARRLKQLAKELEAEIDAAPAALQARLSASVRAALVTVRDELSSLEASLAEQSKRKPRRSSRSSGVHRVDVSKAEPGDQGR